MANTALAQRAALENAFNKAAVDRNRAPFPPASPSGQGNLRQLPSAPNAIPPNLPRGLGEKGKALLPPTPPKAPTPSPPTPLPNAGSLAQSLTNGAARVAGGLAAAQQIGNLAKDPSLGNALSAGGAALMLLPNPYAQAVGLAASIAGQLLNAFKPQANQGVFTNATPTLTQGVAYNVYVSGDITFVNQPPPAVFPTRNNDLITSITGGDQIFLSPSGASNSVFAVVVPLSGTPRNVAIGSTNPIFGNLNHSLSLSFARVDGQPDEGLDPPPVLSIPAINNDGWEPTDLSGLADQISGVSDQIGDLAGQLQDMRGLAAANNGATPTAPNRTPSPLPTGTTPAPQLSPSPSSSASAPSGLAPRFTPQNTPTATPIKTPEKSPAPQPAPAPKPTPKTDPPPDRFKEPSDCNFSCKTLADCFIDLKVKIFDGCNPDTGGAKTKEITLQVLPKDKARTEASFKELLDIRSRECDLSDRVQTTPEYWATRRGQIPQAIVLFKTTTKGENGGPSYYQLQIPHYNGSKNGKPTLPTYQKGEHMAIYECIDGSQMQVYASSEAEALRVINACEKYINPRMRMKDKKNIKTGKRGGMAKVTVKPVRLDFSSTGRAKLSPDWSIPL